jgi:hypothetical protein
MPSRLDVLLDCLKNKRKQGDYWMASCPAHADDDPSLSIKLSESGNILLHCFAGCDTDSIVQSLDLDIGVLFPNTEEKKTGSVVSHKVTLNSLARHVGLEQSFLTDLGLSRMNGGVGVPYYDQKNNLLYYKQRVALSGKSKYRYPPGSKATPYGLWRLSDAAKKRALCIVEGESDCWTLWNHNIPALGVPGASSFKVITSDHLENVDQIFVVQEDDEAGERFQLALGQHLREIGYRGKIRIVQMKDAKDPNELFKLKNGEFRQSFRAACSKSRPWNGDFIKDMVCVMSEVEEAEGIDFIWKPYIPRGVLTIASGMPGVGKSSLAYMLAADLSSGKILPNETEMRKPMRVMLFSSEDDPSAVIRPRLLAHGADLNNVTAFDFEHYGFRFDESGLANLEMMIGSFKPDLLVFDPVVEFVGAIDINRANEVRAKLSPLRRLVALYDVGCLIIAHVNKAGTGEFLNDVVGSQDFGAIVRSAIGVYKPPQDDYVVVKHTKANMTALGRTMKFEHRDGVFRVFESLRQKLDRYDKVASGSVDNVVDFRTAAEQEKVPI